MQGSEVSYEVGEKKRELHREIRELGTPNTESESNRVIEEPEKLQNNSGCLHPSEELIFCISNNLLLLALSMQTMFFSNKVELKGPTKGYINVCQVSSFRKSEELNFQRSLKIFKKHYYSGCPLMLETLPFQFICNLPWLRYISVIINHNAPGSEGKRVQGKAGVAGNKERCGKSPPTHCWASLICWLIPLFLPPPPNEASR